MADKRLNIRSIAEEDIPALLDIERQQNGAPWSEKAFQNELKQPQGVFLVGHLGAQVVGYAGAWVLVDEAHIITVAVHPDHLRNGFARRLIQTLLAECFEKGARCATLEVRRGNDPAIKLYESFGFKVAATRKGYYPDNHEDALVMWLHTMEAPF